MCAQTDYGNFEQFKDALSDVIYSRSVAYNSSDVCDDSRECRKTNNKIAVVLACCISELCFSSLVRS